MESQGYVPGVVPKVLVARKATTMTLPTASMYARGTRESGGVIMSASYQNHHTFFYFMIFIIQ